MTGGVGFRFPILPLSQWFGIRALLESRQGFHQARCEGMKHFAAFCAELKCDVWLPLQRKRLAPLASE
jgi:hypothetical protein